MGHTPIIHQRTRKHKKVSAIAALCIDPDGGLRLLFRLHPDANIDKHRVRSFLRGLLRSVRGPIVLIWDRLHAHRSGEAQKVIRTTRRLETYFLPAYAPELNPVEYLWSYLKLNPLANRPFYDVDTIARSARKAARRVQKQPNLLQSFLDQCPLSF